MKKFYLFVFPLFITLNAILAQKLPTRIYFKNGLAVGENNLLPKKLSSSAFQSILYRNKYYALVQFDKIPDPMKRNAMPQYGIYLFDYVKDGAYLAEITNEQSINYLKVAGASILLGIKAQSKLATNLAGLNRQLPADKEDVIAVSYFGNIDQHIVKKELERAGAQIVQYKIQPSRILFVHATEKELNKIAALPFVSYISRQSLKIELLNYNNRAIHGVDGVSAASGRNLQGAHVTIGMGDNADPSTHIDFSGRLILRNSQAPANHGTHTTGTAAGGGILNPLYRGMAPKATIVSQEFNDILFNSSVFITDYNMVLTNNSYFQGSNGCPGDGEYDALSNYADSQLYANPSLMHVFAAGNDGGFTCNPYPAAFATIKSGFQVSKNVLTVGAIDNTTYGIKASSSRGPVFDGRLKPEIMAGGQNITSTYTNNTYGTTSGTSMSAPTVTGILALMYERYRQLHGGADPSAALMKAIACNSADDLGNPGPDYSFGFGMVNARTAVETIENNQYFSGVLAGFDSVQINTPSLPGGNYQLKIMLYWPDQPAAPFTSAALVNDLDLIVDAPDGSHHYPLILDPSPGNVNNNAVEGQDHRNNIEQVVINNPPAGVFTIRVKGSAIPFGTQNFVVAYQIIKPSVIVEYPFGNNTLVPAEVENIRWSAYGGDPNTFSIEYSGDNGASWTMINNNVPSTSRLYPWTVPAGPTNQALIRVTRNAVGYSDLSDFNFTILGQPAINVTNPCPGYAQLIWKTIPAATQYEIMMLKGDSMQPIATTTDTSFLLDGLRKDSSYWIGVRAVNTTNAGRRSISANIIPSGGACSLAIFNNDFSSDSVLIPVTGRQFSSNALTTSAIQVRLRNLGSIVSAGTFNISYQVNGGAVVTESTTQTIGAGATYDYTFIQTYDFSAAGNYNIRIWIDHPGDANHRNDTISTTIRNLRNDPLTLNPSFTEDFETATSNTYLSYTFGLSGLDRMDFSSTANGRLRTFVNTGFSRSGRYCATLDQAMYTGPAATDSLIGTFNLSNYSSSDQIWLDYYFKKQFLGFQHAAGIWIRGNDQSPWLLADTISADPVYPSVYAPGKNIDLTGILAAAVPTQSVSSTVQVKFSWTGVGQTNDVNPMGYTDAGVSFDDISLTRSTNDVGILSISKPDLSNVCGFSNAETVQIQVKNYSGNMLNNVSVSYSLNGNIVNENIGSLAPHQSLTYSFLQKADISAYMDYDLRAWVHYPGDNYSRNDSLSDLLFHTVPVINSYPYLEGFENNNGNWYSQGLNNNWEWGSPDKTIINKTANGKNAWITGLTGNYNDNQLSYLYSPCFDLTGLNKPVLSFSHIFQTEDACDCDFHWVEYSTDNVHWLVLDTGSSVNWYDDLLLHKWKISDTIWHVSSHDIPVKNGKVRFRFVMSSDPATNYEGVGIDDVHIFDKAPIADSGSVITMTQAVNGNGWVHFDMNGKRLLSMNPLGQDLGNTKLDLYIHPGAVRDTNNQYYLNRNIVIRPSNQPTSYALVRFYFLDSEANQIIHGSGCPSCSGIHDAYESGVTEYSSPLVQEEDSTLKNNINGYYNFSKPHQDVTIIPYDNGYYAEYLVSSFSEFWINGGGAGKNQSIPYMVDSFTARLVDTTGVLQWKIFPGSAVDSFVVEKGVDGTHFTEEIVFVKAIGNITDYQFIDLHLYQGLNYYRVRLITPDGNIQFSPIRTIAYVKNNLVAGVFPNPVTNGKLNVNTTSNCKHVDLYDVLGRFIKGEDKSGLQNTFSVANLARGVYLLKIYTNNGNSIVKILVE